MGDYRVVGLTRFVEAAAAKAPVIVCAAVVVAVAGAWSSAPEWPFYALTVALLLLAALVWARRGLARQLKSREQLGFRRNRDLLRFELFAQGIPPGYYALAFVSLFGFLLTGLRFFRMPLSLSRERRWQPHGPKTGGVTRLSIRTRAERPLSTHCGRSPNGGLCLRGRLFMNPTIRRFARPLPPPPVLLVIIGLVTGVPLLSWALVGVEEWQHGGSPAELEAPYFWGVLLLRLIGAFLLALLLWFFRNPASCWIAVTSVWLAGPPLQMLLVGIEVLVASSGQNSLPTIL